MLDIRIYIYIHIFIYIYIYTPYVDTCCKAMKHRSQHLHAASVDHAASVAAQAASLTNIHRMRWPANKMYARVVLYLLVLHRTMYKRSNMRSRTHKQ